MFEVISMLVSKMKVGTAFRYLRSEESAGVHYVQKVSKPPLESCLHSEGGVQRHTVMAAGHYKLML